MRMLVESLKRLYAKESVTREKLAGMAQKKTITKEEYRYISGEDYDG